MSEFILNFTSLLTLFLSLISTVRKDSEKKKQIPTRTENKRRLLE